MSEIGRPILASHLVLHGYGHWLSNDPRGSGSTETRKDELRDLGDVHFGRRPPHEQPSREELRRFYREATPGLEFEPVWYDDEMRPVIARAFAEVARARGYTVWACAVCSNHAHLVVRTHRDRSEVIWEAMADASQQALRAAGFVDARHPVWSHRPYKVFIYTKDGRGGVREKIKYVNDNPGKEGLPRQSWEFVLPYPG